MQTTLDNEANDLLLPTFDYNNTTTENTDPEHTMAMTLLRTVIPMIVLMGTVGNTLSFCVLVRRNMRSTPMYFYLTLLAVADTFVLYVSAFKVWIRVLTQFEVLHMSNVGCKLFMFILLCSFYLSAWLVVLVTLDRFLVVWFPFRGYLLMRIRRARLTALVLAVIVAVYNFHVFWTISLHRYGSSLMCDASEDNFFMMHVFEYLKLVSYCVVPFVIVIALNVAILLRIHRVYTDAAMRRDCGLREAAAVCRHQPPLVVLGPLSVIGPLSTPVADNVDNGAGAVVWPQRQQMAVSLPNSVSSSSRTQSPLNVQKLRQRRLTRMLLFISFAWLALTAPFTLHSFLPDPPSSSSSSAVNNLSTFTPPASIDFSFRQLIKSVDTNNLTVDRFLYESDRGTLQSMNTTVFDPNQARSIATESFLMEERHTWSVSSATSSPSPSISIDPPRYLLVKTICFLLMYLNHAINFYLYCLTGKRFRKELAAMLNCSRLSLTCRGGSDESDVAPAAAPVDAVAGQNGRRNADARRLPANHQAPPSSTSSRTRSGCVIMMNMNPLRRSSYELNDERYS